MEFSLQDIGSGGWSGVSEAFGGNGDSGGGNGRVHRRADIHVLDRRRSYGLVWFSGNGLQRNVLY